MIGRKVIPRLLFFASIFIGMLIVELLILVTKIIRGETLSIEYLALIGVTLSSALILIIEGIEMYKKLFR